MEIEKIFKVAEGKLAEFPDATASTVLDWIRHNLMDLWFHRDIASVQQSVADDVARAMVNLCCLSKLLKVDLAATLAFEYGIQNDNPAPAATGAAEKETAAAGSASPKAEDTAAAQKAEKPDEAQQPKPAPAEAEKKAEDKPKEAPTGAAAKPPETKLTDKEQRIAMYERELRDAGKQNDADKVEKIWRKDITVDKALDGTDKVKLQKVYNEVKKAIKK